MKMYGTSDACDDDPRKPLSCDTSGASTPVKSYSDSRSDSRGPSDPARIAAHLLVGGVGKIPSLLPDETREEAFRERLSVSASDKVSVRPSLSAPVHFKLSPSASDDCMDVPPPQLKAVLGEALVSLREAQDRAEESHERAEELEAKLQAERRIRKQLETKVEQASSHAAQAATVGRSYYSAGVGSQAADEAAGVAAEQKADLAASEQSKACASQKCAGQCEVM